MRRFRKLLGSEPVAVVATLLMLAGCDKKASTGPRLVYTGPLMETTNVLTLFSDSAKLKLKLTAPLEQQFENGDIVYKKGVKVVFYLADGKTVENTLTANYGKYEKAKNLYIMRGDVWVVNVVKEQKMFTQELFFDKGRQQIYTDSAMDVKVETPTETLLGHGLTANQNFSRYRIMHPTGFIDKVGAAL